MIVICKFFKKGNCVIKHDETRESENSPIISENEYKISKTEVEKAIIRFRKREKEINEELNDIEIFESYSDDLYDELECLLNNLEIAKIVTKVFETGRKITTYEN